LSEIPDRHPAAERLRGTGGNNRPKRGDDACRGRGQADSNPDLRGPRLFPTAGKRNRDEKLLIRGIEQAGARIARNLALDQNRPPAARHKDHFPRADHRAAEFPDEKVERGKRIAGENAIA